MSTFSPATVTRQLVAILRRHGLAVNESASRLSSSRYLDVSTDDEHMRVRLSTHVAKPTYEAANGAADLEIGSHDMASAYDAIGGAAKVFQEFAIKPDAIMARALATRAAKAEAAAAERRALDAQITVQREVERRANDALLAWAGDRWAEANAKASAPARKRARKKLKAEYARCINL